MTIGGQRLFRMWRAGAAALAGVISGGVASGQFGNNGPPPGPFFFDYGGGVFNDEALAGWFKAAALGRVDIVCIGDSNQLLMGRGWDEAYVKVLSRRYRLYATGIVSAGENFGNGAGVGFDYNGVFPAAGSGFVFGASGPAAQFMNASNVLQPTGALSVPAGVSVDPLANLGLIVKAESDVDTSGPLRYWVAHATYPVGSGAALRLSARLNDPPFSEVAPPKAVDAAVGTGVAVSWYDVPAAGPRGTRGSINFRPTLYGTPFTGPMTQYYGRIEDPRVLKGASIHTLYGFGGQSARDMGEALRAASDESLTLYFSMVRDLQAGGAGQKKAVLVRIGTGVNDRSETLPPLEPTGAAPNMPVSFKANLKAITDRVRQVWALNNWPEDELYFLFAISTPITTPDDSLLQLYRDAADELTQQVPRSAVTHFEKLTSVPELKANDWVLFDIDTFHLEAPGHEEMARRELGAASMSAAWSDLNEDGLIDIEDVYYDHSLRNAARPSGPGGPGGPGGAGSGATTSMHAPWSNGTGSVPSGPNAFGGVWTPTDPVPIPKSTDGLGTEQQPVSPTARALLRAARWDEAADMAAGR
ncbi:MAG: hypothetical protein ACKVZJ_12465 [Phycisphaerales bacterium]